MIEPRSFPTPWESVVSVSGGVDSGATLLLAVERGLPFTACFADTGNEHAATYEHVHYLAEKTGVPIRWVRANFDRQIAAKRAYVAENWPREGIPQAIVDRAVAVLEPTGNPFLDLCLWKTRFPGAKSRFCTEELKLVPIWRGVNAPVLSSGRAVVSWQGVRADESEARQHLPAWQRIGPPDPLPAAEKEAAAGWRCFAFRPILPWPKAECFARYRRHGLTPNRLYGLGFKRVGCMVCIMVRKAELRLAARLAPEHIERLAEWEHCVTAVAKRGCATFFCSTDDPLIEQGEAHDSLDRFGIHARVEWSKTSHGGRQYDLEHTVAEWNTPCNQWGACEVAA